MELWCSGSCWRFDTASLIGYITNELMRAKLQLCAFAIADSVMSHVMSNIVILNASIYKTEKQDLQQGFAHTRQK